MVILEGEDPILGITINPLRCLPFVSASKHAILFNYSIFYRRNTLYKELKKITDNRVLAMQCVKKKSSKMYFRSCTF
jgi:hypothetical protein